jgi:hypothetical protein
MVASVANLASVLWSPRRPEALTTSPSSGEASPLAGSSVNLSSSTMASLAARRESNHPVQRTGASRFSLAQTQRHRRLAPVADLCVKPISAVFKHFTFLMAMVWTLSGCKTIDSRRQVNGDEMASALADYVALKNQLPTDFSALRAFDHKRHAVRWKDLRECSFRVVSTNGVRVDYTQASGVSDYRIIFIYARNLTPFTVGSNTVDLATMLTDPKVRVAFYHDAH